MKNKNKTRIIFFILSIVTFVYSDLYSQFLVNHYTVEQGLISNLVKSISQDQDGYIWIGSDAGLMRYDGIKFFPLNENLPSLFIKDIKNFNDSLTYIVTDFGVVSIDRYKNNFNKLLVAEGNELEIDTLVHAPKTIYKDKKNQLWISEIFSISQIKNGKVKKYNFQPKYHADNFFHSFNFLENNTQLFVTSLEGSLFYFNEKEDRFILIKDNFLGPNIYINTILQINDNYFLLGTSDGLYSIHFTSHSFLPKFQKIFNTKNIYSLVLTDDKSLFIGTEGNGLYFSYSPFLTNTSNDVNRTKPIKLIEVNSDHIKNLFKDRDDNIWVSSDDGIYHLKKNPLSKIEFNGNYNITTDYLINNICNDNNQIYFSLNNRLFVVNQEKNLPYQIFENYNTIYDFTISSYDLWISNQDGTLQLIDIINSSVKYSHNFIGNRLNNLLIDNDKNLWAVNDRNNRIIKIDKNFKIKEYKLNDDSFLLINVVKLSPKNEIYCAGKGSSGFIFKYIAEKDGFINITPKLQSDKIKKFEIFDFAINKTNKIYLASRNGFFIIEDDSIYAPINLENTKFNSIPFRSIVYNDDNFWIGSDIGLVFYSPNSRTYFERHDGLPNSTILQKGLVIDNGKKLWIATISGLCFLDTKNFIIKKTSIPLIESISIKIGNKIIKQNFIEKISTKNDIEINFISLNYPNTQTKYQYRLLELDSTWSYISERRNILFTKLPEGNYTLQIRATSASTFTSDITEFNFIVEPVWYETKLAYFFYALGILIIIVLISIVISNLRLKSSIRKEQELKLLVEERTKELNEEKRKVEDLLAKTEMAKQNLEEANELKSQLLKIAAHDLKNPLQGIMGFSNFIIEDSKDDKIKEMSNHILTASKEMLNLINELLGSNIAQSNSFRLNKNKINISKIIDDVIKNNSLIANQKGQKIILGKNTEAFISGDESWIKHSIDNLISNAIKYSPKGKSIYINSYINDNKIFIEVEDEGPGLTDKDKQKLFEPFQKLSAKPTGNEYSTGLGLALVKDIITRHNGKVYAKSEIGKGSTFIIELPICTE